MSNDNEPATLAELQVKNRELAESLARCHALVAEYRKTIVEANEGSFMLNPPAKKRRRKR
jgi:hypothetical protein